MQWKMPDLGEGIQEGEIVRWLVKEGDHISIDQPIVEIMTDKATVEIASPIEGKLTQIVKKAGDTAKVGETIASMGGNGTGQVAKAKPHEQQETKKEPREEPQKKPIEVSSGKSLASPAVRQLAREKGIDLSQVKGSGPSGRILQTDLASFQKGGGLAKPSQREAQKMIEERIPLRGLRRKIAEHMTLSRKTAAHFTHMDEADLTDLVALREGAKKAAEEKNIKLSFLPFFVKALIYGLKKYPQLNASLDEEAKEVILKKYYNIGIAVATEEGLIVPVIKQADSLSLLQLAEEITRLGEATRAQKVALEDLKGGTFTLTNIGSIGGVVSAPIINYPEVGIMGLHKIRPTPAVKDSQIVVRQKMMISVSADHRVVDGAEVAKFLNEVIQHLEQPASLLLE